MCLSHKYSEEKKKELLDKKSATFIAYKVVGEKRGKYRPLFYTNEGGKPFLKTKENIQQVLVYSVCSHDENGNTCMYRPFFHLFENLEETREWVAWENLRGRSCTYGNIKILKCEVQKKYVADVGKQFEWVAIVVKRFKIVGEVE